jgi:hypothetical protein
MLHIDIPTLAEFKALAVMRRVLGARRDELPERAPLVAILRYQFGIIAA